MEYKDYYKTLGVDRKATPADIKKAYRRLARELHPDRNPGDKTAERRFKDVNEAHEVLADTRKRQQYDMLGSNWDQYARAGGAGAGAAGSPFGAGGTGDPFGPGGPFAGYARQGGGGNVRYEFSGGGAEDFSDFFRMFFGGAAAGNPGAAPSNATRASASGRAAAGATAGAGAGAESARTARGRPTGGTHRGNPLEDLLGRLHGDAAGATIGGSETGRDGRAAGRSVHHGDDVEVEIDLSLEEAFHGSARLVQVGDRRLEVKVPRGVETGSKIRLRGKAGSGEGAGDLYLVTKIQPHPVFTRTGADLTRELPITLAEALLGGEVEVETLGGRVVLTIPPGTQQGQTFRLAGKGMPRLKAEGSGDLYAKVKVVLPGKLDGTQRQAAEEFLRQVVQPNPRSRT
ncbi:MAG: J domain-containing protein [Candidatus Limnocylindrales bacterium]|jgi:curved DNA-binding protein